MVKKCICCEIELKDSNPGSGDQSSVCKGTVWKTKGNYGSALYDPLTGDTEFLECFICDSCLQEKCDLVFKVEVKVKRELTFTSFEDEL